jgi:serine/threonine protein phosphatase PrpC
VWLSYIDAPGLAMTRSMGDKVGAHAGVIAEPEIMEFTITADDRFIVVASDGVWEYLSNEDVSYHNQ